MASLLLDIGNSFVKAAWYDATLQLLPEVVATAEFATKTPTEIKPLASFWLLPAKPAQVILVSVVTGAVQNKIDNWLATYLDCPVKKIITQDKEKGVSNGYNDPHRLGADRWVAMIGAFNAHTTPALIVDCGTVVTIDVLDNRGQHHGGWLMPGLNLQVSALASISSGIQLGLDADIKVDKDSVEVFNHPGHSTYAGITQGSQLAVAGLIHQCLNTAQQLLGTSVHCIITGGDAVKLKPCFNNTARFVPELVFEGLSQFV